METTVYKNNQLLRCGYTTGTCAAAAAKAAAQMLLSGRPVERVSLRTPKGISLTLSVLDRKQEKDAVSCAVQKDSGDDPDITNGVWVYARVEKIAKKAIQIDGGVGVGRVTKPGLDQPVGEAAINSTPRAVIRGELLALCDDWEYDGGFRVTISIPAGVELAKKTFNPRLGIEGGLSVLGTSGIVEPMSEQALVESIRLELRQQVASGKRSLLMVPGNYGETFAKQQLQLSLDACFQCSNFIGDSLDCAAELGVEHILLVGHIGKLVKVAGGILQTHSHTADCRMELLTAHAVLAGADIALLQAVMASNTTDEALTHLQSAGYLRPVMHTLLQKIHFYLNHRTLNKVHAEAVVFSNQLGILGQTSGAETLLIQHREGGSQG